MATQIQSTTIGRTRFTALAATLGCALWIAPGAALAQTAPAPKPAAPAAQAPKPAAPAAAPAAQAPKPAAAAPAAAAAPGAGQALAEGQVNPWVKICSKDAAGKDVCLVAQELRTREGQVVASVALREIGGDPKKILLVAIPPMMRIQDGIGVVVDKGKAETGKYTICFPNACYAEVPISDALFKGLQTGADLRVIAIPVQQTQNQKQATFPMKLAGFKLAYDGAGFNPQAEAAKQTQLQDEMNKRAEEMRKKLGEKPAN